MNKPAKDFLLGCAMYSRMTEVNTVRNMVKIEFKIPRDCDFYRINPQIFVDTPYSRQYKLNDDSFYFMNNSEPECARVSVIIIHAADRELTQNEVLTFLLNKLPKVNE